MYDQTFLGQRQGHTPGADTELENRTVPGQLRQPVHDRRDITAGIPYVVHVGDSFTVRGCVVVVHLGTVLEQVWGAHDLSGR